ncbi:hypothetical protein PR048_003948 [Dryococelus australis]|uniref:Uncharacterized protein n=1 Tax=Dryococelus australis TaxID=614101 RepID=A0ABQ9I432_9NEOP|nr:hypothetical protein PR048_003948 [Dryococelus australis]
MDRVSKPTPSYVRHLVLSGRSPIVQDVVCVCERHIERRSWIGQVNQLPAVVRPHIASEYRAERAAQTSQYSSAIGRRHVCQSASPILAYVPMRKQCARVVPVGIVHCHCTEGSHSAVVESDVISLVSIEPVARVHPYLPFLFVAPLTATYSPANSEPLPARDNQSSTRPAATASRWSRPKRKYEMSIHTTEHGACGPAEVLANMLHVRLARASLVELSKSAFAIMSPHAIYGAQTGYIFTVRNIDGSVEDFSTTASSGIDPGPQGWWSSVQKHLGQGLRRGREQDGLELPPLAPYIHWDTTLFGYHSLGCCNTSEPWLSSPPFSQCWRLAWQLWLVTITVLRRSRLLASHQGEPSSIPGQVTPDFRKWKSCRTMPLVRRFSRGSAVYPALAFLHCSNLASFHPLRLSRHRCQEPSKPLYSNSASISCSVSPMIVEGESGDVGPLGGFVCRFRTYTVRQHGTTLEKQDSGQLMVSAREVIAEALCAPAVLTSDQPYTDLHPPLHALQLPVCGLTEVSVTTHCALPWPRECRVQSLDSDGGISDYTLCLALAPGIVDPWIVTQVSVTTHCALPWPRECRVQSLDSDGGISDYTLCLALAPGMNVECIPWVVTELSVTTHCALLWPRECRVQSLDSDGGISEYTLCLSVAPGMSSAVIGNVECSPWIVTEVSVTKHCALLWPRECRVQSLGSDGVICDYTLCLALAPECRVQSLDSDGGISDYTLCLALARGMSIAEVSVTTHCALLWPRECRVQSFGSDGGISDYTLCLAVAPGMSSAVLGYPWIVTEVSVTTHCALLWPQECGVHSLGCDGVISEYTLCLALAPGMSSAVLGYPWVVTEVSVTSHYALLWPRECRVQSLDSDGDISDYTLCLALAPGMSSAVLGYPWVVTELSVTTHCALLWPRECRVQSLDSDGGISDYTLCLALARGMSSAVLGYPWIVTEVSVTTHCDFLWPRECRVQTLDSYGGISDYPPCLALAPECRVESLDSDGDISDYTLCLALAPGMSMTEVSVTTRCALLWPGECRVQSLCSDGGISDYTLCLAVARECRVQSLGSDGGISDNTLCLAVAPGMSSAVLEYPWVVAEESVTTHCALLWPRECRVQSLGSDGGISDYTLCLVVAPGMSSAVLGSDGGISDYTLCLARLHPVPCSGPGNVECSPWIVTEVSVTTHCALLWPRECRVQSLDSDGVTEVSVTTHCALPGPGNVECSPWIVTEVSVTTHCALLWPQECGVHSLGCDGVISDYTLCLALAPGMSSAVLGYHWVVTEVSVTSHCALLWTRECRVQSLDSDGDIMTTHCALLWPQECRVQSLDSDGVTELSVTTHCALLWPGNVECSPWIVTEVSVTTHCALLWPGNVECSPCVVTEVSVTTHCALLWPRECRVQSLGSCGVISDYTLCLALAPECRVQSFGSDGGISDYTLCLAVAPGMSSAVLG